MFGRISLLLVGAAGMAAGVAYDRLPRHEGVRVVFISVGQGDSTLLMSDEWTVLVDAAVHDEGFDAGERLVAPELRRRGVREIDCLVLTHPDLDHIGGLAAVADRFRIGRVIVSKAFRNDPDMLKALGDASIDPSQVSWVTGVARTTLGQMQIEIVAPPWSEGMPTNDGSLFLRVDAGRGSLAMTGDAPISVEDAMGDAYDFDVQILKAGHHGSKYSTSTHWLEETTPEYVVASAGRRNNYGHPNPLTIGRVRDAGAEFLRTDRDGTVEFVLGPGGFVRVR